MASIKKVVWERKLAWDRAQEILKIEQKRLDIYWEKSRAWKKEQAGGDKNNIDNYAEYPISIDSKQISREVVKALGVPRTFKPEVAAAIVQLSVEEMYNAAGAIHTYGPTSAEMRRARRSVFGYKKRQLPKKSMWSVQ